MTCPVCGGYTMIIDSRNKDDHKKRRRVYQECGYKFNTIEIDMDLYLKIAYRTMGGNKMTVKDAIEYLRDLSCCIGSCSMDYLSDSDADKMRECIDTIEEALDEDN